MGKFFKQAGILDPIRKTLAPDVWGTDKKLLPKIRSTIIRRAEALLDTLPNPPAYQLYIIGSITGYQYDEGSDIDINLIIPEESITDEELVALNIIRKQRNGEVAPGTRHPVNYLVQRINFDTIRFQDSPFGVYEVLSDTWTSDPGTASDRKPPEERFRYELPMARWKLKQFESLATKYFRGNISSKRQQQLKKQLIDFAKDIDQRRKTDYQYGFGVPRMNYPNVVYKLIEGSKFGPLFEHLKEIKEKK